MIKTVGLSPEAEKLMPLLQALPISDRYRIATQLLDDDEIDAEEPAEEVDTAWNEEIRRRVEEIQSGKVVGIPAEEVDRRMREKYP
jgi:putative addiction module component (TIGR02574 family)